MTAPAGTTQTYQVVGNREDLSDVIYNIAPVETPVASRIARVKAKNTNHEWLTDTLSAANNNRTVEGDDATFDTANPRVRLNNHTQLSDKAIVVSSTQRAVNTAGLDDEFSYQTALRGKELKRDIELTITQNQASSAGSATVPRSAASMESWIFTNRSSVGQGTSQTTPGFTSGLVSSPTDSTVTGTVTEAALKAVIGAAWDQGGDPRLIIVGRTGKSKLSTFTGIATQYRENSGVKQATILAAADVYVSDFGEHKIVPDRFSRDRTILGLDMDYWALAELQPMHREALAKTGHADKMMIATEFTLESRQEKASFKISDVNGAL